MKKTNTRSVKYTYQLNVRMTEEDAERFETIRKEKFGGELNDAMLGRVLLRKGMDMVEKDGGK